MIFLLNGKSWSNFLKIAVGEMFIGFLYTLAFICKNKYLDRSFYVWIIIKDVIEILKFVKCFVLRTLVIKNVMFFYLFLFFNIHYIWIFFHQIFPKNRYQNYYEHIRTLEKEHSTHTFKGIKWHSWESIVNENNYY